MVNTHVAIRQARKDDESAIDALMNELDEFHVVNLPWLLREKPQSVPCELPIEATLDWATTAGVLRTELGVYAFNEAALCFWRSVGFAPLSHRLYKD